VSTDPNKFNICKRWIEANIKGKTLFITGASRGIGREIALKAAQDGANIVIAAKSTQEHPKLGGSIFTVAQEVEEAGGQALALQLDVRDQDAVALALKQAAAHFGGIDILINNAGLGGTRSLVDMSDDDWFKVMDVTLTGTMRMTRAALAYLKNSDNPHILNLSPPLNLDEKWFASYAPYTITKYGMSMLTLGMNQEFASYGVSVNSLWPRTIIATAAIEFSLVSLHLRHNWQTLDSFLKSAYSCHI
jgi:citronellol/citronellal dehydrogenase